MIVVFTLIITDPVLLIESEVASFCIKFKRFNMAIKLGSKDWIDWSIGI